MTSSFDLCSLVTGFVLGFVASLVATLIFHWYSLFKIRSTLKPTFGHYEGYGFKDENANPLIQQDNPQSTATVRYMKRNILSIKVTHGDRVWTGNIMMETPHFGTVVWRYKDLSPPEHSFGFKRVLVCEDENSVYLYLLGEEPFGGEVFIRRKQ